MCPPSSANVTAGWPDLTPPPTDTDLMSTRPAPGKLSRTIGASGRPSSRSARATVPVGTPAGPVSAVRLVLTSTGRSGRSTRAMPPSRSTDASTVSATRSASGKLTSALPCAYGANPNPPSAPPAAVGFSPNSDTPTSSVSSPSPLTRLSSSCSEGCAPAGTGWPDSCASARAGSWRNCVLTLANCNTLPMFTTSAAASKFGEPQP